MANWFVALPVPAPWLDSLLHTLPDCCRGFVPEDVHLTLAFLGTIRADAERRVIEAMDQLSEEALRISLDRLRPLPHAQRFSAISLTLNRGRKQAEAMISRLRPRFLDLVGAKPDRREALAHITVARLKRRASLTERRQTLAWMDTVNLPKGEFLLDRMACYTWSENREQRQFRIIHQSSLRQ